MDGWVDDYMGGWKSGWMDGWLSVWMDGMIILDWERFEGFFGKWYKYIDKLYLFY